jgi:hypothetical protein
MPGPAVTDAPRSDMTRSDWVEVADSLIRALGPYASPGGALIRLPGPPSTSGPRSDGLEGFARSLLLLGFRVASGDVGELADIIDRYRKGLSTGHRTDSPEAWPRIGSRQQSMVEAATICVALYLGRATLWDPLPDEDKAGLARWLSEASGKETWDNNQVLFPAVISAFLASIGVDTPAGQVDRGLDRLDRMYLGGGWYTDGGTHNVDYYNAWALHYYPPLIALMARLDDRLQVYRDRLGLFLPDHDKFFGPRGEPVYYGRSLSYRFAAATPWWMAALLDVPGLDPGYLRKRASSCLKYFLDSGLTDADGLVQAGWTRPTRLVSQGYSGPASPYWVSKAFLGLVLPANHSSWSAPESQLTPTPDHGSASVAAGNLLIWSGPSTPIMLSPAGATHSDFGDDPHYRKLVYTSATAPDVASPSTDAEVKVSGGIFRSRDTVKVRGWISGPGAATVEYRTVPRAPRQRIRRMLRRWSPSLQRLYVTTVTDGDIAIWIVEVRSREPRVTISLGSPAIAGPDPLSPTTVPGGVELTGNGLIVRTWALSGWSGIRSVHRTELNPRGHHSAHAVAERDQRCGRSVSIFGWSLELAGRRTCSEVSPPLVHFDDGQVSLSFGDGGRALVSVDGRRTKVCSPHASAEPPSRSTHGNA